MPDAKTKRHQIIWQQVYTSQISLDLQKQAHLKTKHLVSPKDTDAAALTTAHSGQSCPDCSPTSQQMLSVHTLSVFTSKLHFTRAVHNDKASNHSLPRPRLKPPGGCFCSFHLHSINSKQAGITCWLRSGRKATSIQRAADSKCTQIIPVSVSLYNIYCRCRLG